MNGPATLRDDPATLLTDDRAEGVGDGVSSAADATAEAAVEDLMLTDVTEVGGEALVEPDPYPTCVPCDPAGYVSRETWHL